MFKRITHLFKKRFSKINSNELNLIAGNLAHLYKEGIAINDALDLVREVTLNKDYKDSLGKILTMIENGKSLSQAFGEIEELYPKVFVGIISIGENSGKLFESLNALKNYYGKKVFIRKEVINAITYPLIILISINILIIFLITIVIPNFYNIYLSIGTKPPFSCELMYKFSVYLKNNTLFSIASILCWCIFIPIILIKSLSNEKTISFFNGLTIVRNFFEYVIVFVLSMIVSSGVNISYGLEYCSESITLKYISNTLNNINKSILKGCTLTEAIDNTKKFSKYTIAVIKVREESGSVGEGLKELSISLENTLTNRINKNISMLQPFLIIVMAILITTFFMIFILPLFDALKTGVI